MLGDSAKCFADMLSTYSGIDLCCMAARRFLNHIVTLTPLVMPIYPAYAGLSVSISSEYIQEVDEYGIPIYWNTITEEHSTVPVIDITVLNYHQFMVFLMAIASAASKSFAKAIMQTI